jgi:hypothetical protein
MPAEAIGAQGVAWGTQGVCPTLGQRAGGGSCSSGIPSLGAHTWRTTIWASTRIIRPSFLSLPGRLRFSCMIPHKPHQLDQGLRGEKGRAQGHIDTGGRRMGYGKVRPVPGQAEQEAILTTEDDPGLSLSPEDAADAPCLPAGGTLLGQDRGTCSLKCNIRCDLFGG